MKKELETNMSMQEKSLFSVADHPTPKIDEGGVAYTLNARDYKNPQVVAIEGNGTRESHQGDGYKETDAMYTLNTIERHAVAIENHPADSRVKIAEDGIVQTLSSRMGTGGNNVPMTMETEAESIVRRLTPLECERLQGYPDGWTDIGEWVDSKGKKHKDADSPRYKALGNSIALPFWFWLLRRISAVYPRPATMGSLFDGIGGFPYCWEKCNGKGTARWASEIEEFPIAVTKTHLKED